MTRLHITLDLRAASEHRMDVCVTGELDGTGDTTFYLPTWTPGSYLIREYSKHLDGLKVIDPSSGSDRPVNRTAKNRWSVGGPAGFAELRYQVHAHELTVRTNHADSDKAYWNGAPTFLWPLGREDLAARLEVQLPAGWDIAIALPEVERRELEDGAIAVTFDVADHDTLVDSPGLAGHLHWLRFEVDGIPHQIASVGAGSLGPDQRLADDTEQLIQTAAKVFGSLPYDSYLFQVLFTDRGGGGLEHRTSTTLLAPRTWLTPSDKRSELLGLIAHEHFHVWNVKRMRPAEFWRYDYEVENHTELLWVAEGFTAYFDDLLCMRAGVVKEDEYLQRLGRTVQMLLRNPGRMVQSLEEASHDAWLRLYRPDPNNVNTTQNYYGNGAVVAWLMDLAILKATDGGKRLDDALVALYRETYEQGRGYTFMDVANCLSEAAGRDLEPELKHMVSGPLEPEFDRYLQPCGLELRYKPSPEPRLGADFISGSTRLDRVRRGGSARAAGLANGDELLALNGIRVTSENWGPVWGAAHRQDGPVDVLYARHGLIQTTQVRGQSDPFHKVTIQRIEGAAEPATKLANTWLSKA